MFLRKIKKILRQAIEQSFVRPDHSILLTLSFLFMTSVCPKKNSIAFSKDTFNRLSKGDDSAQTFHYINASSLKHLPAVIGDLSLAINESDYFKELLGDESIRIYLKDAIFENFKISASVSYHPDDSVYHVKINTINRQATDMALATTLIHETMHCLLLNILDRARKHDAKAMVTVLNFGLDENDTSDVFNNDFFVQMNAGESGQHELIYRFFYPKIVLLLERFRVLHHMSRSNYGKIESLAWSGLQFTDAFKNLTEEKKHEVKITILDEKRIIDEEN